MTEDLTNLLVTPEYLEDLARRQDAAADCAKSAKDKTKDIEREVWETYGSFSDGINKAFVHAKNAHHAAVNRIQSRCLDLGAMLRAVAEQYAGNDAVLAENLDKQMFDH